MKVPTHPDWPELLGRAADIVESYETLVTLRQLFYRLVAAGLLPNITNAYKSLSKYTAEARRAGTFPALMDRGRSIHRDPTFRSPTEARRWLHQIYRRDRTDGQPYAIYWASRRRASSSSSARGLVHSDCRCSRSVAIVRRVSKRR